MNLNILNKIKDDNQDKINFRYGKESKMPYKHEVMVCASTGCLSAKSKNTYNAFIDEIEKLNLTNDIKVTITGCFGLCAKGPIVIIYPEDVFYVNVDEAAAKRIVNEHLVNGQIVADHMVRENGECVVTKDSLGFYQKQVLKARQNTDKINPESIEDYIAINGYFALHKALFMENDEIIEEIKKSGLRGRGGAGFPTGKKWEIAKGYKGEVKYVVCNADEGDPGAFMDRSIIESNPHSIVEAMAIAARTIDAQKGIVYIRAEYPLARARLKQAIEDARAIGFLGENIFETTFSFDIEIKIGAGAFVCGEETALIKSCEGKRGEPVIRPPFPAEKGVFGFPTLINNVETYANIPNIILNGHEVLSSIGTKNSKGTKVFALTGKIKNTGLIELPMGTTIREIVEDIGGGILNGKKFKAIQMGGPSGGCIPASHLETEIDYENLLSLGSMMGSGGMIVMDEGTCMVDIAKFFLEFTCEESCGKCTPCREGNKALLEILTKITEGRGTLQDLDDLQTLSVSIKNNSLCGLGGSSPNPVLSTLKYFKEEYLSHVVDKRCPAGVCKKLIDFEIDKEKCIGCSACARVCPVKAISGEIKKPFEIDKEKCIKCGECLKTCRFNAIVKK